MKKPTYVKRWLACVGAYRGLGDLESPQDCGLAEIRAVAAGADTGAISPQTRQREKENSLWFESPSP